MDDFYTDEKPNECGYYHHVNGNGLEEIVLVELSYGLMRVRKFGDSFAEWIERDKGKFGPRIELPSESI